jgi:DNA polymerase elongation subunit (family B)
MYKNIFITSKTTTEPAMVYVWGDGQHGDNGLIVHPYREFEYSYARDPKGKYLSLYGERLKKIKTVWPKENETLYESDVGRETRVLTDLYLDSDEPSKDHRVLFFDIEVNGEGGYASADDPWQNLTAIANYAQGKYVVFLLDVDGQMETTTKDNETIISCRTEDDLIKEWLKYYNELQPTIITGWNSSGYDVPYLYNRLKRQKGTKIANSLSPIGVVKYNERYNEYRIAGVSHLDYMVMYKKYTYTQQPNYRLDTIGRNEVNMGKVEYTGRLDDLFRDDLQKFIDYNLTDVKIIVHLDAKLKMIDQVRAICHAGHVPYEDYVASSRFIEGTLLTYLHRKGIIAPNKPAGGRDAYEQKQEDDEEGFAGAFVKPPMPGLYDWVYSLDLQSLYPSVIMSLNISPETKVGSVTNWDSEKHTRKEITTYNVELGGEVVPLTREEFSIAQTRLASFRKSLIRGSSSVRNSRS